MALRRTDINRMTALAKLPAERVSPVSRLALAY
jgi:hypothetical protein